MRLKVVSPCPVAWEMLQGDGITRFCGTCNLHVTDLSEMPEACAVELVKARLANGERVCGRIRVPRAAPLLAAAAAASLALAGCTAEIVDFPEPQQRGTEATKPAAGPEPRCPEDDPGCLEYKLLGDVIIVE